MAPRETEPEGNRRTRHARIQAWRASFQRERTEGHESQAGGCNRSQRGWRIKPADSEREPRASSPDESERAPWRDRTSRDRGEGLSPRIRQIERKAPRSRSFTA